MIAQARDMNFEARIDQIAAAIEWPEAAFNVSPWEAVVGVVAALYEALATPDRALLGHALNGIAF